MKWPERRIRYNADHRWVNLPSEKVIGTVVKLEDVGPKYTHTEKLECGCWAYLNDDDDYYEDHHCLTGGP